jgi:preprotein translocase subunit SecA
MRAPSLEYKRTDFKVPAKPLKGLDVAVNSVVGIYRRRPSLLSSLAASAKTIEQQESQWKALTNHDLQQRLLETRTLFRAASDVPEPILLTALAGLREAALRFLGLRAFHAQLIGALALHRGFLAEMATGEGKTLTAGLAAALAGWSRSPCHVITVNDYLVERDATWLEPFFHFCGIRVGFVTGAMNTDERRKAYCCDVTYTTSKELLADLLRDRLRLGPQSHPTRRLIRQMMGGPGLDRAGCVLRGLHTAIVDEADSILIDEAVTPLIIASEHKNDLLREAVLRASELVSTLQNEVDYRANRRFKEVELTPAGFVKLVAAASTLPGIWKGHDRRLELVVQGLVAREFFHRDQEYIIENAKVMIVDEFTGRPMPQRTWREGMHQAIEAKEGLAISDPAEIVARLSFQRFFRCFYRLSGMTGTARELSDEFWQSYALPVVTIPTNRPCIREEWPDRYFSDAESKVQAIADETARLHASKRPVLIGTRSVFASERLAEHLRNAGLNPRVLNATRLSEEAQIVALAGEISQVTIATNMAGRGTDIKLGKGVAELGGLHVIATERQESARVDRQLFGRCARQGDPGTAQAFVSLEDDILRRHLGIAARRFLRTVARQGLPGKNAILRGGVRQAQINAQKLATRQRKAVLQSDLWMEEALSFSGG